MKLTRTLTLFAVCCQCFASASVVFAKAPTIDPADGTQVLPENWMKASTTPSKGYPGYGYFWWLSESSAFRAVGIFGQGIYINPEENVVIAQHSARATASNQPDWALQTALYEALTKAVRE